MDIFDIIDSCSSNSIDKNIVLTEAGVVEKLASRKDPVYQNGTFVKCVLHNLYGAIHKRRNS